MEITLYHKFVIVETVDLRDINLVAQWYHNQYDIRSIEYMTYMLIFVR